jgi:EAL domain-containing protein (putative c-di-GMP-specific phosphodiesterase class I)
MRTDRTELDVPAVGVASGGAASYGQVEGVGFLFASIANLTTGAVVGVEMLPRPRYAGFADVLAAVSQGDRRTVLDAGLAAAGLRWNTESGVRLPVHLNLLAETVAHPPAALDELHDAIERLPGDPEQVVLEIGPLAHGGSAELRALLAGARRLRERGYRLLVDGLEAHDPRLAMILELAPEQVKLHPNLVAAITEDAVLRAAVDAVRLCRSVGTEPLADGISTATQLEILRAQGIRFGQGTLLAVPGRRPLTQPILALAGGRAEVAPPPRPVNAPPLEPVEDTIGTFARSATTLPVSATGGEVRDVFRDAPLVTAVVLVDEFRQPVGTLDRNRFMLAVSGPYGHALRAGRPVLPLADPPRTLPAATNSRDALELLAGGDPRRRNDDIVVVDRHGQCIGIAHVADLLRGIAELAHERALALHPITRMNGTGTFLRSVLHRVTSWSDFAAGWLVPDLDPLIERSGFAAAEAALRQLAEAARSAVDVDADGTGDLELSHVFAGIMVLTGADRVAAVDAAVRARLADADAPALWSAWLSCTAGQITQAGQLDGSLARLLASAKRLGPNTALSATPDSVDQPTRLTGPHGTSVLLANPA